MSAMLQASLARLVPLAVFGLALAGADLGAASAFKSRRTTVAIVGEQFHLNGQPTYAGRTWRGHKIEGLLMNARLVQGIFDDRNPETVGRWAYPDTGRWDPERNTREFIAAMPEWRRHGLLAFTINLQGGSPTGYANQQPWHNSAFEADGSLRVDYLGRLERILDQADELGMAVILGYFYFGQDQRLANEAAVVRATDNATQWLFERGYRHVLIEINNECDVRYDHPILQPARVHELIERVKSVTREGRRFYVSTSYGGGAIPLPNVVRASDFLLLHGNGVSQPERIAEMARRTRAVAGYTPKPILFNEDDHFEFDQPWNNCIAAVSQYASWGYFDYRMQNEGFDDGYQSVPVNWGISSERKRGFFRLLADLTGAQAEATARLAPGLSSAAPAGRVAITRTNYHGWPGSIRLSNGRAEVMIVPAIGRVMQFTFAGDTDGPFWENRRLHGQTPDPTSSEWNNFGGDKTWPAPQADWPNITPRAWPPPVAFDAMPVEATIQDGAVVLTSPVDPHYGIRTRRRVELDPAQPVMTIRTAYEKVQGEPCKVAVWTITQLDDPVAVFAPVPDQSLFANGYNEQSKDRPQGLKVERGLLSCARSRSLSTKIGTDADTLLWVGETVMVKIESPRLPGAEYPDQGSSAEIYTNPDPLDYVELELLGPLRTLKVGDQLEHLARYTLLRRGDAGAEAEARSILGRQ